MSNNDLCDSIGNNMNDIDEIGGLLSIKEIENTSTIKTDEVDLDKYNFPLTFNASNPPAHFNKNDESDLVQYSLLKELEDKWNYIEKNKKMNNKRNVTEVCDSKSFNTNYTNSRMISLQNCKSVIEESRKKYFLRKEKEKQNEDFDSFVKEKSKQLRQLTRNYTTSNGKANERVNINNKNNNKNVIKSFLQPEDETQKENKNRVIDTEIKTSQSINNGKYNNSKIYNKIKNIFGIITNDKSIITEYNNDTNANISSVNKKDLSLKDLNKNFDKVLEQLSPNMKRRTIPTCNNNTSSPKEKYSNVRMINKINQNKSYLNELLPNSQTKKTNYHSYVTQSQKYKSPINSYSYTFRPKLYERNNFSSTETKLFYLNSPTIGKIIKY